MLTNMKGEINNNIIIMGDFNSPLTPMDRSTKEKIKKETQILNDTIDQLDPVDIYRTFHPKTMNVTFFSSAHEMFSRIDHFLGHKSSLGKFKNLKSFCRELGLKKVEKCLQTRLSTRAEHSCKQDVLPSVGN